MMTADMCKLNLLVVFYDGQNLKPAQKRKMDKISLHK
jgi:hypothetical protein